MITDLLFENQLLFLAFFLNDIQVPENEIKLQFYIIHDSFILALALLKNICILEVVYFSGPKCYFTKFW